MVITCPECDKQINAPDHLAGKKIRCKDCGHVFVVPAAVKAAATKAKPAAKPAPKKGPAAEAAKAKAKPKAPSPAAKPADDDEDDPNPYGVTELDLTPRCPHCAGEMEDEEAVVCLHCGYNTHTRLHHGTTKTIEHTFWDWFLWLLPGIACVLFIGALIGEDIWYVRYLPDAIKDQWYGFLGWGGFQLWNVIISLFMMFFAGRFAIKRLILHPRPPEKIKEK
jgi:predicted Zn finger-like uncharacterized protein